MRGNPHAAFDVAGAGNVAWSRWCDTRKRKGEPTGNTNIDLNRRVSPRPYWHLGPVCRSADHAWRFADRDWQRPARSHLRGPFCPKLSAADASPATAPGQRRRIDSDFPPPCGFIAATVDLAMVSAAERDGELIADLAAECPALGEAQMVGIRRDAAADQARVLGHLSDVLPVPNPAGLRQGQRPLVDPCGPGSPPRRPPSLLSGLLRPLCLPRRPGQFGGP